MKKEKHKKKQISKHKKSIAEILASKTFRNTTKTFLVWLVLLILFSVLLIQFASEIKNEIKKMGIGKIRNDTPIQIKDSYATNNKSRILIGNITIK